VYYKKLWFIHSDLILQLVYQALNLNLSKNFSLQYSITVYEHLQILLIQYLETILKSNSEYLMLKYLQKI